MKETINHNTVGILDCTLRDGGYINNWQWGKIRAQNILNLLSSAGIDAVEVGFLRNDADSDDNTTICHSVEQLNQFIPLNSEKTTYAAMAMQGAYDVNRLDSYSGKGIEMIRVTFHENDIVDGLRMASDISKKNYKVAINPINIMGYDDAKLLQILKNVEEIHPYQFTIVDTFGCMKRRDLDRIVSLVDHNLSSDIAIGLHLHDNMSMSFSLAQQFLGYNLQRSVWVDASLMGIGRAPGNLQCELLADYLNEENYLEYDINELMDAIENYIEPMKGKTKWGYAPVFFLSAKYNLHRNYSEWLSRKGNLTTSDINKILSKVEKSKASIFDPNYIEELYRGYISNKIDDKEYRSKLEQIFKNRKMMVLCPGKSIRKYKDKIKRYVNDNNPIVIAVNFVPDFLKYEFVFLSNPIRSNQVKNKEILGEMIITSNIYGEDYDYIIDYNKLLADDREECNGFLMILRLLKQLEVREVVVAGADGYEGDNNDYFDSYISSRIERTIDYNSLIKKAISEIGIDIRFITKSAYEIDT